MGCCGTRALRTSVHRDLHFPLWHHTLSHLLSTPLTRSLTQLLASLGPGLLGVDPRDPLPHATQVDAIQVAEHSEDRYRYVLHALCSQPLYYRPDGSRASRLSSIRTRHGLLVLCGPGGGATPPHLACYCKRGANVLLFGIYSPII